ncbi:methyltransferase domain-containing protein [Agrobacterium sp. SHOUNA12C]|uniref:class I SAM-dependent methyltransferase n=1 Tax=Rhizobium rhizogenes TaxID=359 RepID=UPI001F25B2CA|nr:methyltransferase domain-containing protein [Rhizobium rhizogenes]MCJ9722730.1 methyltransferase domain-containing protein [Agrobacterium sp. BETTINA12B]MCJ9756694.1 methyltransferase domain-containing protein [Agrobacterium sp. SHOUNA12C]MDJ1634028.1 methyltransferase domain-containing protein [Rhizobium rhizogenes]WEO67550.1 methyltransferase domain-containing protein [Rhizobium rhizogenes]
MSRLLWIPMPDQGSADISSPAFLHAKAWAEAYELIDLQLSPLGLRAIETLDLGAGDIILDIGCGAGQTLLQLAERVGAEGRVIGVDVAPLLLEIASRRTEPLSQVRLIQADAQSLDLSSESTDAVFSRFGVMSFDDPVAAFANFRRILRPSGTLAFTCWRSLEDNELDHLPLSAAGLQSSVDESPFSFADPEYIRGILEAAGFEEIVIQSHDEKVSSGDLDAMSWVLLKVGPLGKIVRENPALRATAEPLLRKTLAALGDASRVELLASVWIVTARAEAVLRQQILSAP